MTAVRNAVPADAARLLEIYSYYVEHTAVSFEYEAPTLAEFQARMARTMQRYPYLVVTEDGRAAGYAYAAPFGARAAYGWSCEASIYLDRDARGRGLGRALYQALEAALSRMGVVNLYACVAVPETDDPYLTRNSAEFHAHLGYTAAGSFPACGYKFGRWYGVLWMQKTIAAHETPQKPVTPYPLL